ncbi:MAG: Asp-tRNA(Asn)/Glu-tRNA(Gln) amidotransferase GatCAB subunit A, partial [Solirubrobacteraceae bacterium]
MAAIVDLTAAQAIERVGTDFSAAELFEAYRERAAADDLNAFTWVAEEVPADSDGPLKGVPLGVK